MPRKKGHVAAGDLLYSADQAVRSFCKEHKGNLSDSEHKQLRKLLHNRADAMSKVMGVKVHSLFDK